MADTQQATLPARDLSTLRIERGAEGRRRVRIPWLAGIVVLLVLGGLALLARQLLVPRVVTDTVARVAATQGAVRTTASGYVVARRRAAISSRLSGRLEALLVDVNDRVEKGQLVGRLGQADLVAAVAEARAALARARSEVGVAEQEVVQARSVVATSERRDAQAEAALVSARANEEEAARQLAVDERLLPSGGASADDVAARRSALDVRRAQVAEATAGLAAARAETAESRTRVDVLAARLASAHAAVDVAQAGLERAEALRDDADIRAPFDGVVLRKEAEVGEMVAPVNAAGSTTRGAIVTLADFESLEMEVDVIERDIGRVTEGLPCRIVLDACTEPFAGRVRQVVPTADRTRGTVQVKVVFDALDDRVRPEMSGRVEFLDEDAASRVLGKDRVLVPERALTTRDGARGVFLYADRAVTFHAVATTGAADADGRVEVAEGLRGGEVVVLDPDPKLAEGARVQVAGDAQTP